MRAFVVVTAMVGLAGSASAATFSVTSTLDTGDKSLGDGKCADQNNKCTLRAAVDEANATPATADVIQFNITGAGAKVITLAQPLAVGNVTIDATTQAGYAGTPVIELNGAINGVTAFMVTTAGCEIRGLRMSGFAPQAVSIQDPGACTLRANHFVNVTWAIEIGGSTGRTVIGGPLASDRNVFTSVQVAVSAVDATDVEIVGNYIGTDETGTIAAGASTRGIDVVRSNAVIRNNVIAASPVGVWLTGTGTKLVENNLIGTNATGTAALGNSIGIKVDGPTTEIANNTISGNTSIGVLLTGPQCVGTKIHGNRIGTTSAGTAALGNQYGIQIDNSARGSIIGGTDAADRNVLSGNYLGLYVLNQQTVFDLSTQTRDHQILGNYIGPALDGSTTIGNQLAVYIYGAARNVLTGNRIWGNANSGVAILGPFAVDNTVRQNVIANNGGLPIDLEYDGITPNDSFDADTGANYHQNFPEIQVTNHDGITQVGGTLTSQNLETYTLDFFKMTSCASGNQMGEYVSSTTVSTNAAGNAQFVVTLPTVPDGTGISATATSTSGSTSELSYCATASACLPPQVQTSIPQATVGLTYQQQLGSFFPTGTVTFSVIGGALPDGMSLASDGWLTGLPTQAGTYQFTVHVVDLAGCSADYQMSLFVCPAISISPPVLPRVQPNVALDITFTADGGVAPYQYYFQDVPTPGFIPGVQLYPQGVLHGTPTTIGIYAFTLAAYDASGCVGQRVYSLAVGCTSLYVEPTALPLGDVGAPYDVTLTAMGGRAPYYFTASQLPAGLHMSEGGHITGKPRARGLTPVTFTVFDAAGCTLEVTLGLQVVVLDEPGCESTGGDRSPALVLVVVAVLVRRRRRPSTTA